MKTREFNFVRLEERIAPTMKTSAIPSVNADDPAVNGAEHAIAGLTKSHASDAVLQRHTGTPTTP